MIDQPFRIFDPFIDTFCIAIFAREEIDDEKAAAHLGATKTAGLHQVHGSTTILVENTVQRERKADGMITKEKNLALCTRWADCQNFVFYEPDAHVLGVLHAGWKGLHAGAIPSFFDTLLATYTVDTTKILVGAGPSLCQKCAGFTDPHTELPHFDSQFFDERHVDLRGIADQQIFAAGVVPTHFERSPDCTRCMPEKYWTYRGGDKESVMNGRSNMLAAVLVG